MYGVPNFFLTNQISKAINEIPYHTTSQDQDLYATKAGTWRHALYANQ